MVTQKVETHRKSKTAAVLRRDAVNEPHEGKRRNEAASICEPCAAPCVEQVKRVRLFILCRDSETLTIFFRVFEFWSIAPWW